MAYPTSTDDEDVTPDETDEATTNATTTLLNGITRKQTSSDPYADLNISDFSSTTPDAQSPATYYPSTVVNPVQYHGMAGKYFAELPLVMGGQTLYPFGLQDARNKAIQDAALRANLRQQKENAALLKRFPIPLSKPAYTSAVTSAIDSKIFQPLHAMSQKYGSGLADVFNNPDNPNFQEGRKILNDYADVASAAKSSLNIAKEIALVNAKLSTGGQEVSKTTRNFYKKYSETDLMQAFNDGDLDLNDLAKIEGRFRTYNSFDTKTAKLKGLVDTNVDYYIQNGIKDSDGKLLTAGDGTRFYDEVQRQLLTSGTPEGNQKLNDVVDMYVNDENLNPDDRDPAKVRSYLKGAIPNLVKHKLDILRPQKGTTVNIDKNDQKDIVLSDEGDITTQVQVFNPDGTPKMANGAPVLTLGKVHYKGAMFKPSDIAHGISINSKAIAENNEIPVSQRDKFKADFITGDHVGVLNVPVNAAGKMTTAGSPGQVGYANFAVIKTNDSYNDASTFFQDKKREFVYYAPMSALEGASNMMVKGGKNEKSSDVISKKDVKTTDQKVTIKSDAPASEDNSGGDNDWENMNSTDNK